MTTVAEYHAMMAAAMTEDALQQQIITMAERNGWLVYHTHDSRRSQAGYPDLHLVHGARKLSVFRELKSQKGKLRPDQLTWLTDLQLAGVDALVWRPVDWFNGTIEQLLAPNQNAAFEALFDDEPTS